MSVQLATVEDASVLKTLHERCLSEAYPLTFWEQILTENASTAVSHDGNIVGYCLAGQNGYVYSSTVLPDFRLRGYGRLLLGSLKAPQLSLYVRIGNTPAQTVYRKFGFEVTATEPSYYRNGEDGYLMKTPLRITRPATITDASTLMQINETCPLSIWTQVLSEGCSHVALVNDQVVGYCLVQRTGYLFSFAVLPEFRRQGHGRRLLAALNNYPSLSLHVRVSNVDAQTLYHSMGFTIAETKPYYEDESAHYMTKGLLVREATTKDASDLAALDSHCFMDDAFTRENWERQLQDGTTYIAILDGKVVGSITVDDKGYIGSLAIHPAYRRRGYASRLLYELPKRTYTLHVRVSNEAARSLYEKHGFAVVKTIPEGAMLIYQV